MRSQEGDRRNKVERKLLQEYVDACELIREAGRDSRRCGLKKETVAEVNAEQIKTQVEAWIHTVPIRMQRIVRYRYVERLPWEQVAGRMGRGATADSVRMEFGRFLRKN